MLAVEEELVDESVPARGGGANVGWVSRRVRDEVDVCAVCGVNVVVLERREGEVWRWVYVEVVICRSRFDWYVFMLCLFIIVFVCKRVLDVS